MENNMKPIFSIVVPVYNAEKYLKKTLEAVRSQEFTDFEVLLIDDGSTDNSLEICKLFEKADNRFSVYHKTNGGVCSARNCGIELAKGEYIVFMDSDDIIEPSLLLEMLENVRTSKADIVLFGMQFDIEKQKKIVRSQKKICNSVVFDVKDLDCYYRELYNNNYITSMCNRITRLKLIKENDLEFNENITNYEDMAFGLECIRFAKKIQVVEKSYYHYILHEDLGMSRKYKPRLSMTLRETVRVLLENIKELPLSEETKKWAYRDVQRILWIGVANICRKKSGIFLKKNDVEKLCMEDWVGKFLPMETTGNKYNDICVMLYKKKFWLLETLWNMFTNFIRDIRY